MQTAPSPYEATTTHPSPHLLSLGGDGVNLVNEDNGRGVLLSLLKSLTQVALGLTCEGIGGVVSMRINTI